MWYEQISRDITTGFEPEKLRKEKAELATSAAEFKYQDNYSSFGDGLIVLSDGYTAGRRPHGATSSADVTEPFRRSETDWYIQNSESRNSTRFKQEDLKKTCVENLQVDTELFDAALKILTNDGNSSPTVDDILTCIEEIHAREVEINKEPESPTEEYKRLSTKVKCQKCEVKERSALFIPCGHLQICIDCSRGITRCTVCNKTVRKIVKTFMG
ncbi:baculoviral IAP repeat-containing protein 8-like isoform X2 [Dreissena polymorpha]|uniref:baculoviral IAP repeat-containing protein 8-like isoform X2 n=1 Tax=Dreissena polymorpha TaxID=45954 RepID=UPI002264B76B|nr:baculoviral IAP repeat-containing protein 8-like isoform X2 [Dreissena polymorpha]